MSNEKVAEVVSKYHKNNDVNGAVESLIEEATKNWIEVIFQNY